MTIASNVNRVTAAGNGSTTAFAFAVPFVANNDLVVILRAADGTETTQTLGTDYSVSGAGNPAGGTVAFTTAPAAGVTIVIYRDVPLTQPMNLQDGGPLPASTANGAFDRLTMIMQRLYERVARGVNLRETDTPGDGMLDAGGNELTDLADGTAATSAVTVQQLAAVTPALDGLAAAAAASADSASASAASASGSASAAISSAAAALSSATDADSSASDADASAAAAAASAAQSKINWRGQWLTATAYAVADAVQNGGSSYFCIAAHTAGSTTQPGVGASWQTVWSLMAAKGAAGAGTGDMLAATYDPSGHAADTFNRANHTGTQAISTIVNLQSSLDAKANASAVGAFSDLVESIKTANYSVLTTDAGTMLVCNSSTSRTFTLPTAASASGMAFHFRNIGTASLVIDGNGSETIEGTTTLTLLQGCATLLWSNGTTWRAFEALRVATTAEAQAATATGVYMDPTTTKSAISTFAPSDPDLWVRDEEPSGTGPGNSAATSYQTRTLNTVKRNVIASASLSASQIHLPAGTYWADFSAPFYVTASNSSHRLRLFNITDSVSLDVSKYDFRGGNQFVVGILRGCALFTLSAAKVIALQQYTTSGCPLGAAGSTGDVEIYGEVMIWKVN